MTQQPRRPPTPDLSPLQGELQSQIMAVLWRLGPCNVEGVRAGLPARYRSAYTTVQTVLNRLSERGLLKRDLSGNSFLYCPRITEAEYLTHTIDHTLSGASGEARQAVLAQLVGNLDKGELSELQTLARDIAARRKGRKL